MFSVRLLFSEMGEKFTPFVPIVSVDPNVLPKGLAGAVWLVGEEKEDWPKPVEAKALVGWVWPKPANELVEGAGAAGAWPKPVKDGVEKLFV